MQSQDEVTRQVQELEHKEWQLREKQQALDCERELSDNYKRIINMADSEKLTRMQEIQSLQMALQVCAGTMCTVNNFDELGCYSWH